MFQSSQQWLLLSLQQPLQQLAAIAAGTLGAWAIAGMPVQAMGLATPSIGDSDASDYLIYDINASNQSVEVPKTQANLDKVIGGDKNNPTGHVELAANSEQAGFNFSNNTTLQGQLNGNPITISSLTQADWTADVGGGKTFGQKWFSEALVANGFSESALNSAISMALPGQTLFNLFANNGGFQRFSDPNIAYVNQDGFGSNLKVGLIGHLNATPLLTPLISSLPSALQGAVAAQLNNKTIQASEIFKYEFQGKTGYGYSFSAVPSGFQGLAADHTGLYEVEIPSAPTPALLPALVGFGLSIWRKRKAIAS